MLTLDTDHQADVEEYIRQVSSGEQVACKWVRLAVKRREDDLAREDWDYHFDWEAALKPIRFIELFPHIKGHWANRRGRNALIQLEPWQKFIIAEIFGWIRTDTGYRRFTKVYISVARKNGKSTVAAGIALFMSSADGEYGAEVYCGATSQKQAWEVFGPARKMALAQPQFRRFHGVEVHARKITSENHGIFEPIIGNPGDGASPSCSVTDEYHEHQDDDQLETMVGGMGARTQPLSLVITTAGDDSSGPCFAMEEEIRELLDAGGLEQPDQFGIIFTLDPEDEWSNLADLKKANPNYGVSVGDQYLQGRLRDAVRSARKQNKFRTRHANQWVSARDAWMNSLEWLACADPEMTLERFAGCGFWGGLDMSSTDDLTAWVKLFRELINERWHYFLFVRIYCTEFKLHDKDNPNRERYQEWEHNGWLTATDGNMIDYQEIEDECFQDSQEFVLEGLAYDPWGAEHLAQRVGIRTDMEPVKVPPQPAHISEPMQQFQSLVKDGRMHTEGNPCMDWMMGNVISKEYDDGKRIRPVKAKREKKIDGPVAGIMALKVAFVPEAADPDAGFDEYIKDPVIV